MEEPVSDDVIANVFVLIVDVVICSPVRVEYWSVFVHVGTFPRPAA
jgi:hypothetical protein